MKSDSGNKNGSREDSRKTSKTSESLPQINMDPEKRRDFFNKLLEKYSTKSTKNTNSIISTVSQPQSQTSSKMFIPVPTKSAPKSNEKSVKKKKIYPDKSIVAVKIADENPEDDRDEMWKTRVKCHSYDYNVYKNHNRVRNRYHFPLPRIEEQDEPLDFPRKSVKKGTNDRNGCQDSVNHSFTFYHSGDQETHKEKGDLVMRYKEKLNSNSVPFELKPRHLTKTLSGSMIWAGNDMVHSLFKPQKKSKTHIGGDEPSDNDIKLVRRKDDTKSVCSNEERHCKTLVKVKKSKSKKTTAVLELDDGSKSHKQSSSSEERNISSKPSASSLPQH